jgi:hypothetical protein
MRMLIALSAGALILSSIGALAEPDGNSCALGWGQAAGTPANESLPPHKTAYTDHDGFHFDSNGMLIDDHGRPIVINDDGSMVAMPN